MPIIKPFMASRKFTATIGDGTGTGETFAIAATTLQIEDKMIPADHVHYAFMAALNGIYATVKTAKEFLK